MSIVSAISRLAEFYRRHGFAATVSRAQLAAKRMLFAGRMVVFYCDLKDRRLSEAHLPEAGKVERVRALEDVAPGQIRQMTEFWNSKLATRDINERFAKGANLWLVECEGQLAGYGWTLQGTTVEPYYFPLAGSDIHFFDFHVFPRFRGRGINPFLVCRMLSELASQNGGRAFIEAAEWNAAQLASLQKTPFRRFGLVRSFNLFGRAYFSWTQMEHLPVAAEKINTTDQSLRIAGSSEP
jgi:ribosomal protein S18 acetylase RimI-like enzyme